MVAPIYWILSSPCLSRSSCHTSRPRTKCPCNTTHDVCEPSFKPSECVCGNSIGVVRFCRRSNCQKLPETARNAQQRAKSNGYCIANAYQSGLHAGTGGEPLPSNACAAVADHCHTKTQATYVNDCVAIVLASRSG